VSPADITLCECQSDRLSFSFSEAAPFLPQGRSFARPTPYRALQCHTGWTFSIARPLYRLAIEQQVHTGNEGWLQTNITQALSDDSLDKADDLRNHGSVGAATCGSPCRG